jgi:hypothetical protein
MLNRSLPPVAGEDLKRHVLSALQRYWSSNAGAVAGLPVRKVLFPDVSGPLRLVFVVLPDWARGCGVDGRLAVPREACLNPEAPVWENVDWWLAAFLMLECWHERNWELNHGPIHSYSLRLSGWDARIWDHAWVNRIALFFRKWAARQSYRLEGELLGALPEPEFVMTHDVDAVSKTVPIRLKQGVFNLFNAGRAMARGNVRLAMIRLAQAVRFLFGSENWWTFDRLIEQERKAGIRSHFNFFFDRRPRTFMRWLFDPGYDISTPQLSRFIKKIHEGGWVVGLHPTFDAWQDPMLIYAQRKGVESILGAEVKTCRQHWLRFAWGSTWAAQSQAGIHLDTTLMLNDRPGFRAAVADSWAPWNPEAGCAHNLSVLPTVLMDSHLYDYHQMTALEIRAAILAWLGEVRAVGGKITVVWHPHTLTDDYGWTDGFMELVHTMSERTAC